MGWQDTNRRSPTARRIFRSRLARIAILVASVHTGPAIGDDVPRVVISEIQYHPYGDFAGDEFLELENRGAQGVDIGGWTFIEGIALVIPEGTYLAPGAAMVVSPDRDATARRYGIDRERIVGNWQGRLDNGGELLELVDRQGRTAFRVHYRDEAAWPEAADGFGPSLELCQGYWDAYLPGAWRASPAAHGTPGEPTSPGLRAHAVVSPGASWRWFRGTVEPSGRLEWTRGDFDDSAWETGREPFGHGDASAATTADGIPELYTTLYARIGFALSSADLAEIASGRSRLLLTVRFRGAMVVFVNGRERLRAGIEGNPGRGVGFDESAPSAELSVRELSISGSAEPLASDNVVAIQALASADPEEAFFLSASIVAITEIDGFPAVTLNEIAPATAGDAGFVEVFNAGDVPADLSGAVLVDDAWTTAPYTFPPGSVIPAKSWSVVQGGSLPFPLRSDPLDFVLLQPGVRVIDALAFDPGPQAFPFGRVPDGSARRRRLDRPSPGGANSRTERPSVVIHEIHYHPPEDDADDAASYEFIEIFNPTESEVSLDSWSFRGGVDFDFPPGAVLGPLELGVIAADPATIASHFGLAGVFGPYQGRLSNAGEEIILRDASGEIVASVQWFDEGSWPAEADGTGRSLELVNASLDPSSARSWRPSDGDPTPGRENSTHADRVAPFAIDVAHSPVVPSSTTPVTVTCRVTGSLPPATVVLRSENDTLDAAPVDLPMNDDGASGDLATADGVWTAIIPPQPDGSTIRFEIEATDADGGRARSPLRVDSDYLYEVNDRPLERADIPHYALLLTRDNWRTLRTRNRNSRELLDSTFVDLRRGRTWYGTGVRYRGNGSRNPPDGRFSFRVRFAADDSFDGLERLNLNSQNTHRQVLGNRFFERWGLPYPATVPVALRKEGEVDIRYARVEAYDGEFLERYFESDSDGNLYRGLDGALEYRGATPQRYRDRYSKETNEDEDDWSDLIALTQSFTVPDDVFLSAMESSIDVAEWVDYFAAEGALGNNENSINLDAGDDYFLYARPSDGRFLILPWDADTVFVTDDQPLFRPSADAVQRLLSHPEVAPLYWCALEELQAGLLSRDEVERELARIEPIHSRTELDDILRFLPARHAFLDANIPRVLELEDRSGGGTLLISPGDEWSFWRGRSDPSGGDLSWTLPEFDDSRWERGPSGFGYGDGDDETVLLDMRNDYGTVFIRKLFPIADVDAVRSLALIVDFDDGFVAWLNGVEIARRNFDRPVPRAVDIATRDREAGQPERFAIPNFAELLVPGTNALALVGLNGTLDSSDLSLIPALEAEESTQSACAGVRRTSSESITLQGFAPACATRRVLVGGADADYDPRRARWSHTVPLAPGFNAIEITALDDADHAIEGIEVAIERTSGAVALGGRVDTDRTLTRAGGPYAVSGGLEISAGARVTVEAGTIILLDGAGSPIVVEGSLEILGTPEEPVNFRPGTCNGTGEIVFLSGASTIAGLVAESIDSGEHPLFDVRGSAHATIESSSFFDLPRTAIAVRGNARIEIRDSSFAKVGRALDASENGSALLDGARIENVPSGVAAIGGAVEIVRSELRGAAVALRFEGGEHRISETLISGGGVALSFDARAQVDVSHVTIAGNGVGLEMTPASPAAARICSSSIIWENGVGLSPGTSTAVEFRYSDVQGGVQPGPGNLSSNPRFVDSPRGDYRLQADSPAIGAGEGGSDMGAFPAMLPPGRSFIRGDFDASGSVNLTDAIAGLEFLFRGGAAPRCADAADTTDDGAINLTDPVLLLNHLFLSGPPPAPPYPDAGSDPTPDALDCE